MRPRPAAALTAPATEAPAPAPDAAEAAGAGTTGSARPTVLGLRGPATLQGVRLGAGATLLLEPGRELAAADLDAILDAAGPLLAVLRDRGLEPRREHP
jgi:hypothetical protein